MKDDQGIANAALATLDEMFDVNLVSAAARSEAVCLAEVGLIGYRSSALESLLDAVADTGPAARRLADHARALSVSSALVSSVARYEDASRRLIGEAADAIDEIRTRLHALLAQVADETRPGPTGKYRPGQPEQAASGRRLSDTVQVGGDGRVDRDAVHVEGEPRP